MEIRTLAGLADQEGGKFGQGIKKARGECGIPTWEAKSETVDPAHVQF